MFIGDFAQLDSIESKHYDVINSEVFSDIGYLTGYQAESYLVDAQWHREDLGEK